MTTSSPYKKIFISIMNVSLVGLLILTSGGCSKSPAQLQKKYYSQGQHYLTEGKVNEAIIEFQNLLKINPKSAKGRMGLGKAYLKKGWTAQAVLEFQEVTKESPLNLDAHLAMADYGINSGQWNAVKPEIATILKIDPNNVEGLTFDGERELALGHKKKALIAFQRALSLSPGSVPTMVGMGDLLRHQDQPDKAKLFYQKALSSDPKNSRALTGLGRLAQAAGNLEEADSEFRKAMEVDPSDLRSRIIYTNFLARQGHVQKGIELLKIVPPKAGDLRIPVKIAEYDVLLGKNSEAIALLHPLELQKVPLPDIYLTLAQAYQNSGQIKKALNEAVHLSTMDGATPVMKVVAANVELAGGVPGKARDILNSINNDPSLPVSYWQTKGRVEEFMNNPSKAIKVFREGLKIYPNSQVLLITLADAQAQHKNFKESLRILDGLLKKDPKNSAIIGKLGILIGRQKGPKAEINFFRNFAKNQTDIPGIEPLYILSLAANNHLEEALKEAKPYLEKHPDDNQVRLLMAQVELKSGKRDKAIALYKYVLDRDPKNGQALQGLAAQDLTSRHFPEAESLYRRLLSIQPENANFEVGLGEALLGEKQSGVAVNAFQKALSVNPNQPQALFEVAKADLLSGKSQLALSSLAPLLKINFPAPQKAQVQWLWGLAAENNGDIKTAIKSFQKAILLDPKNETYHASLGNLYANISLWDKALPELDRTLSLKPDLPLVQLTRDWVLVNKIGGNHDSGKLRKLVSEAAAYEKNNDGDLTAALIEARADILLKDTVSAQSVFDHILLKHPNNISALLGKSAILLSQNHLKKARSVINRLLAGNPDNVQGNLMMASIDQKVSNTQDEIDRLEKIHQSHPDWVQPSIALINADLALGRFEEAKSISFTLHEANPSLPFALFLLGNAEMGMKDYRGALRDFGKLVKLSKKNGPTYNMMSVAAMKLGETDNARKYLNFAIKESPNDPIVLNNLAFFLADNSEDLPKALGYAKHAVSISPKPFIQDTVGFILFKMGEYNQAESYFNSAYRAHFRDAEFLYHMGMNEWKLGNQEMASKHLRLALGAGSLTTIEQKKIHKILGNT